MVFVTPLEIRERLNWGMGGGGVITSLQKWKIQGGMGSYVKFPLW